MGVAGFRRSAVRSRRELHPLHSLLAPVQEAGPGIGAVSNALPQVPGRNSYVALAWIAGENPRGSEEWHELSGWKPDALRKPGLNPRTLIDVGAATGTPALYAAFPDAYRVMIDPLEEHEQEVDNGEFICTAVGNEQGEVTIELGANSLEHSTVAGWRGVEGEARTVPLTTLDALAHERGWNPPFGLKVDAEGYEYEVILGAKDVLRYCEFVIAEVQVANRFHGQRSVTEFFSLMEYGRMGDAEKPGGRFVLVDILDGQKSEPGSGLHYFDGLFLPR